MDITMEQLHPVLRAAAEIEATAKSVADVPVTFVPPAERRAAMLQLIRIESQLTALRLRLMAVSDDVALDEGARDVAALLTHHARLDRRATRSDLALADALERRWLQVASALSVGELNPAQAKVITQALESLPADEVDDEVRHRAEAHLVAEGAHHGPRELALLGRKILEVVAPERYERQEAAALAREERRARELTSLTTQRVEPGVTRIVVTAPDVVAERLRTYLEAFASPRRRGVAVDEGGNHQSASRRLGRAFCSFLEAVDPRRLPAHGGDATTLVVTVPLEELRRDLGVAVTAGGERLSASETRRLACTARIVPAVLGGRSEVLDLGRGARLFNPAQRRAMVVRDGGCRAEGCTIPAAWCEAHHAERPWSKGGRTDLADGVLLCSRHHHRAHDSTYAAERMPNGDVRLTRRE